MTAALWTIAANPRRKARKSRKHRTAAQRAATRRMLAANRARTGGHHKRRTTHRRRTSAARTTRVIHVNPRRTARRSSRRAVATHAKATIMHLLKAGAVGAGGALAVDIGYGFVAGMLPVSMQTKTDAATGGANYMYYAGKGAIALALGAFGGKLVGRDNAARMAAGSLVVMMYELARPLVQSTLPNVNMGYFSPVPTLGAYRSTAPGLGVYRGATPRASSVHAIKSPMAA